MSKESRSKTLHAEEWDFSEENLPDNQVELCYRHEYRREFYLAKGIQDDSVTPFLRIPPRNRTGTIVGSMHDPSERDVFMRAAPGANNPFHENPYFRAGPVVPADVLDLETMIHSAFSPDRKGRVIDHLRDPLVFDEAIQEFRYSLCPAFFYQSIQPAKTEDGLVAVIRLNTKNYGIQELLEGFRSFLERFTEELGSGRGPRVSAFRKRLTNLAIVRIRHVLSFRDSMRFFHNNSYFAQEFLDKNGGSYLEMAMNHRASVVRSESADRVEERIRERRRLVLESFHQENPQAAGQGIEPACFEEMAFGGES